MPYINDGDNFNAFITVIKEPGFKPFDRGHFRHFQVFIPVKRVSMVLYVLLGVFAFGVFDNCSYCTYIPIFLFLLVKTAIAFVPKPGEEKSKSE